MANEFFWAGIRKLVVMALVAAFLGGAAIALALSLRCF